MRIANVVDDSSRKILYKPFSPLRPRLTAIVVAGILVHVVFLHSAMAQSLNEAVENQLITGPGGNPCEELTGGLLAGLGGQLLTICSRGAAGGAPSNSTGGGAGISATLPTVVLKRLEDAVEDEPTKKTSGSSATTIFDLGSGVNLFVSGEFESLDRDSSSFEDGYDSNIGRVTVGADYRFTDKAVAGLAFDYFRQDADFDGGGGFDLDSYGFLVFGTFLPLDEVFVQITAGWARKEYDRRRFSTFTEGNATFGGGPIKADHHADNLEIGALAGYDYVIDNITITPQVGFNWRHWEFDGYEERGDTGLELRFDDDNQTSLQSVLGVRASMAISTNFVVLLPQAGFAYRHEFENDQRTTTASFVDDGIERPFRFQPNNKPDRNFFEVTAGIGAVLPHGIQVFGNYRTLQGNRFFDSHAGTIGIRLEL